MEVIPRDALDFWSEFEGKNPVSIGEAIEKTRADEWGQTLPLEKFIEWTQLLFACGMLTLGPYESGPVGTLHYYYGGQSLHESVFPHTPVIVVAGTCSGGGSLLRALDRQPRCYFTRGAFAEIANALDFVGLAKHVSRSLFASVAPYTERNDLPASFLCHRVGEYVDGYLREMAQSQGKVRWCDYLGPPHRTPLDTINTIFDAHQRIVIVTRHGLTASARASSSPMRPPDGYQSRRERQALYYFDRIVAQAKHWVDTYDVIYDFSQRCPHVCYMLKAEDLMRAPAKTMQSLMHFLDEEFDESAVPQKVEVSPEWEGWPAEYRQSFAEILNPTLTKLGYDAL